MSSPPPGFDALPIASPLRAAIAARGITAPTTVQSRVVDAALAGRDLLVSAQTGSGKTLAFGLLIAQELLPAGGDATRIARGAKPAALVLAPTRELAVQVQRELDWLLGPAGARVVSVTGGSDAREEMRRLRAGCEVLVATPGRLVDHLERRTADLSAAKVVVLDEGDEMLRFGFREDLETILQAAAARKRTHLFSATLPAPILKLAETYQRDAARVSVGGGESRAHEDIEFVAHLHSQGDREGAVVNVLRRHDAPAAIVFTATRAGAAKLGADLVRRGFAAVTLSGEMTQAERTRALASLREGRARVLVATDVAARGLDLPDVALVIHADPPGDAAGITHRSGRTGRAGRKGVSVLLAPRAGRSRVERMMRAAGVSVRWSPLPTAEEIAAADVARLIEELAREATAPIDEARGALVDRLLERIPARELTAAFLARIRGSLPPPADVRPVAAEPSRPERPHAARAPRDLGAAWVQFRVNLGRRDHMEPRSLLPLICRRGGIEGRQVGKIDVQPRSTTFQVEASVADGFESRAAAVDRSQPSVRIARVTGDAVPHRPAPPPRPHSAAPARPHAAPERSDRRPHSAPPPPHAAPHRPAAPRPHAAAPERPHTAAHRPSAARPPAPPSPRGVRPSTPPDPARARKAVPPRDDEDSTDEPRRWKPPTVKPVARTPEGYDDDG